jgi:hypothetical protein
MRTGNNPGATPRFTVSAQAIPAAATLGSRLSEAESPRLDTQAAILAG